jgi:hypothetical protein
LIQIVQIITSKIHSYEFLVRHRKNKSDFTRNRTLTFPRLISFLMNAVNGSIQSELSRFFQVLEDAPVALTQVTTAAFSKARKKLSHHAFIELNHTLIEEFYKRYDYKRWHGFRLLAVDGSVTQLPTSDALWDYFGQARITSKKSAVRLSQLYDVNNKLTVDLKVDAHAIGERNLALQHLKLTQKGDMIIYDRGYPAVWFFKYHYLQGVDFCARAMTDSSNILKEFVASKENSLVRDFPCTEKTLRRCRKDGLSTESVRIRLVKVQLSSGDIEVLLTSLLDEEKYPSELFGDLYHRRWGIEEDYKVMKSRLNIENFSGLTPEAVFQDIYAKTLTKNMAALTIIEAEKVEQARDTSHRKYRYKINVTQTLSQLKDNIVRFMMHKANPDLTRRLVQKISTLLVPFRPHRKFERNTNRMHLKKYPMAYKRVC